MTTEISLMQITKIKREAAFSMPETHFHDDHEVLYLVSGECNIFLNHTIYKLQAGDMVLIPSGYIHKTNYTGKGESTRFAFRFTTDDVRWLIDTVGDQVLNELLEKMVIHVPDRRREYVETLMNNMYYEVKRSDEYSAIFNKLHFQELMMFVIRCMKYEENYKGKQLVVENDLIQDVAQYIYKNFDKNIYLEKVAKQFNISRSYLSKKFKATTGVGFKEYITNVRIQEACRRLLETDHTITQIAIECGFNDSNYFGDAFRHYKGISPNKYRKNRGTL